MSHHKCEADHYSGLLLYWMGVELQLYSLHPTLQNFPGWAQYV